MGLTSKVHTPPHGASGNAGTLPCHRASSPPVFPPRAGQCIGRPGGDSSVSAIDLSELWIGRSWGQSHLAAARGTRYLTRLKPEVRDVA